MATPVEKLPPLPPGFKLDEPETQGGLPPLPPGFTLDAPEQQQAAPAAPQASALSRFASNAWEQVNPVEAVKGLAQAVRHPIDTAKAIGGAQMDLIEQGGEAIGMGDREMAMRKLAYGAIPLLGPAIDKGAGQFAERDIAGGLGTMAGIGANLYGPKIAGKLTKGVRARMGSKLYESALKPSTTIDPARRASMVETGLSEGIPVSPDGLDKIGRAIYDLNRQIATKIESAGPARTIDPNKVAARLDDVEAKFSNQVNPKADLGAIKKSRQEFLERFGGREAPPGSKTVYHGTPHTFDEFSSSRIGTGEGAQAFGHGLYFAENQSAASFYKGGAGGNVYSVAIPEESVGRMLDLDAPLTRQPDIVRRAIGDIDAGGGLADGTSVVGGGTLRVKPNSLGDPTYWLESGDKSFRLSPSDAERLVGAPGTGQAAYQRLATDLGGDRAASEFLRSRGVDGLRYKDAGSRGQDAGTSNFVLFDERKATITKPPRNLTAAEAQAMKQGTYRQLKGKAYGEMKTAEIEAQKALARGLKEELAAQFPELTALNAKEGALIGLEAALEKAVARTSTRQLIGLDSPLAGAAVAAGTGSGTAGAVAAVMRETLRHPAVSTRLAIALSKGAKSPLSSSRTRIAAYARALGQASEDASSSQGDQASR